MELFRRPKQKLSGFQQSMPGKKTVQICVQTMSLTSLCIECLPNVRNRGTSTWSWLYSINHCHPLRYQSIQTQSEGLGQYLSGHPAGRRDRPAVYALLFLMASAFTSFPQPFGLALHLRKKAYWEEEKCVLYGPRTLGLVLAAQMPLTLSQHSHSATLPQSAVLALPPHVHVHLTATTTLTVIHSLFSHAAPEETCSDAETGRRWG